MDTIINLENRSNSFHVLHCFWDRLSKLLFHSSSFFRFDLGRMTISDSLTFGAVNYWLASLFDFFISTVHAVVLARFFEGWLQRLLETETAVPVDLFPADSIVWKAGFVVLTPFLFLLRVTLSTAVLYVFAKIFIEDDHRGLDRLNYGNLFRIQSVSLTSAWYRVVPIFGGILAFIVHKILLVTGIRERYSVSTKRALAVVIGPYVILFFIGLLLFSIFIIALSQVPFDQLLDKGFLDFDLDQFPF